MGEVDTTVNLILRWQRTKSEIVLGRATANLESEYQEMKKSKVNRHWVNNGGVQKIIFLSSKTQKRESKWTSEKSHWKSGRDFWSYVEAYGPHCIMESVFKHITKVS